MIKQLKSFLTLKDYDPDTVEVVLSALSQTLTSSERILEIIEGQGEGVVGMLLATDLRVLYVGYSPLNGPVIKSFGYCDIISIESIGTDYSLAEIEISRVAADCFKINHCQYELSKDFVRKVKELVIDRKNRSKDVDEIL